MNTEKFNNIPFCIIKNNVIIKYNKEFQTEFNYPQNIISFNQFKIKSEQNINNNNYVIYNIGEDEDVFLFFNKKNIPNLNCYTNEKDNLFFINFDNDYLCYNINIDNHHLELCKTINMIIKDCKNNNNIDDIIFDFSYLLSSVKIHFNYEESLMDKFQLDFSEHKKEHKKLLEILTSLMYNLNEKNIIQSINYLKYWLLDHIIIYDKKLNDLIKNY